MREASPLSFFGTRTSQEASFLRYTTRQAFTPHTWPAVVGKRSCENGIRISTRPAFVVDAHRRLPDRVPGVVQEVVVVDRRVALHAGRAHLQGDAGAPVAVRVEVERERVGLGERVAPRELAGDPPGLAVAQPRADVEGPVVEQDAQLGRLGRGLSLVGVALEEAGRDRGRAPARLVQPAVEEDRRRRADCAHGLRAQGRRLAPGGEESPEDDELPDEVGTRARGWACHGAGPPSYVAGGSPAGFTALVTIQKFASRYGRLERTCGVGPPEGA
jgi:hypothetical protein